MIYVRRHQTPQATSPFLSPSRFGPSFPYLLSTTTSNNSPWSRPSSTSTIVLLAQSYDGAQPGTNAPGTEHATTLPKKINQQRVTGSNHNRHHEPGENTSIQANANNGTDLIDESDNSTVKVENRNQINTNNNPQQQQTNKRPPKELPNQPIVYQIGKAYVTEYPDRYELLLDVPGVKAKDLSLKEVNGTLHIVAERKASAARAGGAENQVVVSKHTQSITIDKNRMDVAQAKAELTDGVLTIRVPKRPEPQPVPVRIQSVDPPVDDDRITASNKDSDDKSDAEKPTYFRFTMDVPGMKPSNLQVTWHKGDLIIQGHRPNRHGGRPTKVHRTLTLNDAVVDTTQLEAYLMDGVLTIRAPRHRTVVAQSSKTVLILTDATTPTSTSSDSEPAQPKPATTTEITKTSALTDDLHEDFVEPNVDTDATSSEQNEGQNAVAESAHVTKEDDNQNHDDSSSDDDDNQQLEEHHTTKPKSE